MDKNDHCSAAVLKCATGWGAIKLLFVQSLEALITDCSHKARAASTSLLCEIIPELAKGDELEMYMSSVLPLIVKNMKVVRAPNQLTYALLTVNLGGTSPILFVLYCTVLYVDSVSQLCAGQVELRQLSETALKMFVKHTGNLAAVALMLQEHGQCVFSGCTESVAHATVLL